MGKEYNWSARLIAEFLGTFILVMSVVGSGIMAVDLTSDTGLQLFINALATILALSIMILLLGPISGAHFNPVVSIAEVVGRRISKQTAIEYISVQFAGGFAGVVVANLMFNRPAVFQSHQSRDGVDQFIGEVIATAGLILIIHLFNMQDRKQFIPFMVPAWIGSAYFFTSSTSFANPVVTFARSWSDTFTGIALKSVPVFIAAQLVGAIIGMVLTWLLRPQQKRIIENV